MDAARLERLGTADVVFEIRVAAVDDDVVAIHRTRKRHHRLLGGVAGREHHPYRARTIELTDEILEIGRARRALALERRDRRRILVEHHAAMLLLDEAAHD